METAELLAPFERLLADVATPDAVRVIEGGGDGRAMWAAFEASGYLDALVPETAGGAALSLSDAEPLFRALGRHAVPLPVAETMAARALLAADGKPIPPGPLILITGAQPHPHADRAAVVRHDAALRPLVAVLAAAEMAGCCERLLEMSIAHANERSQFGKPIAKQQAIQHLLAVMGEQLLLARMAAQIGCAGGISPDLVSAATAKSIASTAACRIAANAHAVHGAMGITAAFDLHLYTNRLRALRLHGGSESYWAQQLGTVRLEQADMPSVHWLAG
jgi:acyl-CoA dehydrogenase